MKKISATLNAANLLALGIVFMALISLQPFFTWDHSKFYQILSTGLMCLLFFNYMIKNRLNYSQLPALICCVLFLLYITILPKSNGEHSHWFFLIPIMMILFTLPNHMKIKTLDFFSYAFIATLIPSFLISTYLLFKTDLHFQIIDNPSQIFSAHFAYYLYTHGTIFINSNSILLPNHGILTRLCAIWPEPGTVGSLCALLLAADGFKMNTLKNNLLFLGGFLSFSLAFFLLSIVGIILFGLFEKKIIFIPYLLCSILGLMLIFNLSSSYSNSPTDTGTVPLIHLNINGNDQIIALGNQLRQTQIINNRTSSAVENLYIEGTHHSKSILFGVSSDQTEVNGDGNSASWKSVFINYGIVGLMLLFLTFFLLSLVSINKNNFYYLSIFLLIFLMNFYQKPMIWMPFYFVIFIGGLQNLSERSALKFLNPTSGKSELSTAIRAR